MEYILVACLFLMAIGINGLFYYWLFICIKAVFSKRSTKGDVVFNALYVPIVLGLSVGCTSLTVYIAKAIF